MVVLVRVMVLAQVLVTRVAVLHVLSIVERRNTTAKN